MLLDLCTVELCTYVTVAANIILSGISKGEKGNFLYADFEFWYQSW